MSNIDKDGNNSSNSTATRVVERFQVRRALGGWVLVPQNPENHPLLARLFGYDSKGSEPDQVVRAEDRKILDWDSLEDGLRRIRNIGAEMGLGVRICGNIKRQPTVLLWEREPWPRVEEAPANPFAHLRGDAAKWGVSDFDEEHEKALRQALASAGPFDTGWYGVKKEIQSARVWREKRNGRVLVHASASMDEWRDLTDTAVWAAWGKRLDAGSGFDVLTKLGLSDDAAETWLARIADSEWEYGQLEEGNSVSREGQLARNAGFDRVCEKLDELADACEAELKAIYDCLVERCAAELTDLKRDLGASCKTCKFFHDEIPESRVNPADPADCGHPKYFAILSANKAFPFVHGCKFWQSRNPRK